MIESFSGQGEGGLLGENLNINNINIINIIDIIKYYQMIESFSWQGEGGLLGEDKSENWKIFRCQNSTVRIHWGKEVGVPEMYIFI